MTRHEFRWVLPKDDHETIVAVVGALPRVRYLQQHTFSPGKQQRQMMRQFGWSTTSFHGSG